MEREKDKFSIQTLELKLMLGLVINIFVVLKCRYCAFVWVYWILSSIITLHLYIWQFDFWLICLRFDLEKFELRHCLIVWILVINPFHSFVLVTGLKINPPCFLVKYSAKGKLQRLPIFVCVYSNRVYISNVWFLS